MGQMNVYIIKTVTTMVKRVGLDSGCLGLNSGSTMYQLSDLGQVALIL